MEVFQNHSDMILQKNHISIFKVNWNDKAYNIKQIAEELNIGLDSIVFVDDSEFETDFVRNMLPEVETLCFKTNGTFQSYYNLFYFGLFDTLSITDEDYKRNETYRMEKMRKKLMNSFSNLDEYYYSMNMEINIGFADQLSIPRIAQLTHKTNQFNLTNKRYSELDIWNFSNNPQYNVVYLRLKDRLSDYGIVGVCILHYSNFEVVFDTFLLSCRVLGRKVEEAFLAECLKISMMQGIKWAVGIYRKTERNAQVESLYTCNGFEMVSSSPDGSVYKFDIGKFRCTIPGFFKISTEY